ncbi:hypothetical protein GCM10007269_32010 [Microbacterium murale]|uniref:Uncharacterized protein n=1 Tax=Microbacterium murale TaxID=1081040 RepID=A0ABQ1RZZ1_9MICO|nr:hypothetical protein GCM10007269_32010 [Microbacterium murale]
MQSTPLETAEGDPLVGDPDGTLPPEVFQWRRARDLHALKESHERLVEKINAERPQIFAHHRGRREARLREEIRMDSIARTARGLPAYEMDAEVKARLDDEVSSVINRRLTALRDHTVERAKAIAQRRDAERDAAAPHRAPAVGSDPYRGIR